MDSPPDLSLTAIDGADLAENLASSSSSGSIKTDQGNPVNPEGRSEYDKDLLLHLQYSKHSMENPDTLQHLPAIIPDEVIDSIQEEEEPITVRNVRVNNAGPLPGNVASPEGKQPLRVTSQAEPNSLASPPLPWCDLDPEKVTQVLSRLKNPEGGDVEILMVKPALKSSGEETLKENLLKPLGEETKEEVLKSFGEETTKEEAFKSFGEETTKEETFKSFGEKTTKEEVMKSSGEETAVEEIAKSSSDEPTEEEAMKSSGEETTKKEFLKLLGDGMTKVEVLKTSGDDTTKEEELKLLGEETTKEEVMKSSGEETTKEEVMKSSGEETAKEELMKSSGEETAKEELMKSSGEETTKEEVMKSSGEVMIKEEVMVKGAIEEQGTTNEGEKDEIKEQKNEMKRKMLTLPQDERELYRKVRSILYKLTPQKFQTSIKQVQGLVIDTETKLKGFTDIIFEKAISEPAYSVAYANMCRYLLTLKVPSDTKPGESVNFRVILLTRCQREFEKDEDTQLDLDRRKKDIEEATDKKKAELKKELVAEVRNARWRSIGNIRFIGELFKLKMLTETIMHDCVFKLLRSRDEVNLECLCHLLTTIGKELESEKAKPRMDQYFQQIEKIFAEKKISHRCQLMLQNIIDLRNNSWKPRDRDKDEPKAIDQINKDAESEAVEQNMGTALRMAQRRSQKMRHQSRTARGRPSVQVGESIDGIRDVDSTIDVSKLEERGTLKSADKNIDMTFRGSGDGSRASQEGGMSKATVNRRSALSNEDFQRSGALGQGVNPAEGEGRMRGNQPGGGFNRRKVIPRSFQEEERERAVASARNLMSGDRTTTPSGTTSREGSRNRGVATHEMERPVRELSERNIAPIV